ncbi:hypothetical protein DFJ73DRAFT_270812 [Zopfochytrium polystomum]|nr:hypothetical protein DFJ73DRAFT_270812 [Zopfochytrium polystomum]
MFGAQQPQKPLPPPRRPPRSLAARPQRPRQPRRPAQPRRRCLAQRQPGLPQQRLRRCLVAPPPQALATPAGGSGFGFQPKASTAGGLSLGGATPAAAAGAAAGGIQSLDAIVKTTRYGELPEAVRGELDKMEKFIQKQISLAEEIQTNRADELILRVREQAQDAELKYQGLKNILDRDASLIKHLRSTVSREMKNADMATRFIDAYQNPNPSNYPFRNQDYFSYFVDVTNQLESKLQLYRQTIDDLERHLQGITQRVQYTPQSIVTIMRHQHESFLAIASKIAAVHDAVQKEKENFLHFRRRYFGETRNPFVANAGGNTYGSYTPLSVVASALKPSVDLSQQQQQQQQPAAGGFGSGAFGGGFGSTAGKSTGAFGTGAFGTAGAGATPSLFGGASTQPGAAKTGGGLFGAAATPAPAAGGGLFGQPAAGGGLFGAPQQPAAGGGGGLFGGAATPAGQQPAGGTGLFGGGAPAATAPAFGGGATSFGSSKRR